MSEIDLVIRNATVVNHDGRQMVDIAISGNKIVAVGNGNLFTDSKKEINGEGLFAVPGLIDPHVHLGNCQKFEDDVKDSVAAVFGGITTIGNFIGIGYTHKEGSYLPHLQKWIDIWEENSFCHTFFHIGITSDKHAEEMELYARDFGITSFKYWVYSQEDAEQLRGMTWINDGHRWEGFEKINLMGPPAIAMAHMENMDIIRRRREHVKKTGRMDLGAIRDTRPRWVEAIELVKMIYLSQVTGAPLYVVHVSAAESVDLIAEAKSRGLPIICESNPAYLTRTSDDDDLGVKGVEWPALKDQESIERLWKGINENIVDTLGTDHCPIVLEEKPDIWTCEPGYPQLETFLPIMLSEGVNKGRISLEKLVGLMSFNICSVFGLENKGKIAAGYDADIVLIDLELEKKIDPNNLHYWHGDFTLYDSWKVKGWPMYTIISGEEIVVDGELVAKPGIGRYLPRKLQNPQKIPTVLI